MFHIYYIVTSNVEIKQELIRLHSLWTNKSICIGYIFLLYHCMKCATCMVYLEKLYLQFWATQVEIVVTINELRSFFSGHTGTPGDWSHIIKQIGMFTFTGLNTEQVTFMTKEYHIYMTSDG